MLRAVLIDVGGTLWPDLGLAPPDSIRARIESLGEVLPDLHERDVAKMVEALDGCALALDGQLEQRTDVDVGRVLASFEVDVDPRRVIEAMCLPMSAFGRPFEGAGDLLTGLRQRRLRVVAVSNAAWRGSRRYGGEFLGAGLDLDGVVSSLDVGFRKPHLAMFEAAMEVAGAEPGECAMIGDAEINDIEPAAGLGMRTILVCIQTPPPSESLADAIVNSLPEAHDVLRRWMQRS